MPAPISDAIARPRSLIERVQLSRAALWVVGLTLAGLGLRIFWSLYVDTIPLGGDPHWYYVVGINIANGDGFVAARNALFEIPGPGEPTAFWPPGYPFALGALFWIFGSGVTQAQMLNAVLGALTIPFVYLLGAHVFNRSVGIGAAAIFAFLPNAISGIPVLFPEPLFTFMFMIALWLLVRYPLTSREGWPALVAFGFLVGVSLLTRGQAAVLLPVALFFWAFAAGWLVALRTTALATVVAAAVIAPWTIRNYVELDAFIPISTNAAAALRVGHNEDSIGTTKWTDDVIEGHDFRMDESLYNPEWEVIGYREYNSRAIDYALTHPANEIRLSGLKIYHLYRTDTNAIDWLNSAGATPLDPEGLEDGLSVGLDVSYYLLLFAAVASVPLWLRRDRRRWLLVSTVLVWTAFHMAFLGEPRYHVPLFPIFAISAAAGIAALIDLARRRAAQA